MVVPAAVPDFVSGLFSVDQVIVGACKFYQVIIVVCLSVVKGGVGTDIVAPDNFSVPFAHMTYIRFENVLG